jgi:predicted RNA-binding protein YlqC (UPF0109 family)
MQQNKIILEMVENVFRLIVSDFIAHPENLEVLASFEHGKAFAENPKVIVEARCHYADQGRIIGKQKVNFTAIETILSLVANHLGIIIRLNNLLPSKIGSAENSQTQELWSNDKYAAKLKELLNNFLENDAQIETRDGKGETTFNIVFHPQEKLPIAAGNIAFSLSKIFHAIGKARNQTIKITAG